MVQISKQTARRFVLGRQGLWPGRRWAGKEGVAVAIQACEAVQMDPLNVVARSHDISLWGRVLDYRPELLEQVMYTERRFFDYGGLLSIYPMAELPYWRLHMQRRRDEPVRLAFAIEHQAVLDDLRLALSERGPLGNRDFNGNKRVNSYRGSKDTSVALYYLWLTGETMVHHRQGFQRLYDLSRRIAPPELDYTTSERDAEAHFARKIIAANGLVRQGAWASSMWYYIQRRLSRAEASSWLEELARQTEVTPIEVEGTKVPRYCLSEDLPLLEVLEAGEVPAGWQPLDTTTLDEAVFLAPLDRVSSRELLAWLFDYEYLWEVYKPAAQRRWGYYTLPVLYGDRFVARLDPRLERVTKTLHINGFWLEDHAPAGDTDDAAAFATALGRGLARFAGFVGAERVMISAIEAARLRSQVSELLDALNIEWTL